MSVVKLADRDQAYRDEVVDKLEKLLEAAKQGRILSIVYACEQSGNTVTFGGTRIKDRYTLLGFLAHKMFLTLQSIDEDATPSDLTEDGA